MSTALTPAADGTEDEDEVLVMGWDSSNGALGEGSVGCDACFTDLNKGICAVDPPLVLPEPGGGVSRLSA